MHMESQPLYSQTRTRILGLLIQRLRLSKGIEPANNYSPLCTSGYSYRNLSIYQITVQIELMPFFHKLLPQGFSSVNAISISRHEH